MRVDSIPASQNPPDGLVPGQVPQLVCIGFDDNSRSGDALSDSIPGGGIRWILDFLQTIFNPAGAGNSATFDGTAARVSFYVNTITIDQHQGDSPTLLKRSWNEAFVAGHEIGNHTHTHQNGSAFTITQWKNEVQTVTDWLARPVPPTSRPASETDPTEGCGISSLNITGFRTPFLAYINNTFSAIDEMGYVYDCSIEEGFQTDQDGTNFLWPYTLDSGSPGDRLMVEYGLKATAIGNHPGLWEIPAYCLIVPPDSLCAHYGIESGLRMRLKIIATWFDTQSGKITGYDYNLWSQFSLNKQEFLATLKYTFDLRYTGNRCPMMLGAHSQYYHFATTVLKNATVREAQEAIEEFITYVISKPDARMVRAIDIVNWMKNPRPLTP